MRAPSIIAILIGLFSLSITVFTLIRMVILERSISGPEARVKMGNCYNACHEARDADMDSLEIRAFTAQERHLHQLLSCQSVTHPAQREKCLASENEAYQELVNGFKALQASITERYRKCGRDCGGQAFF